MNTYFIAIPGIFMYGRILFNFVIYMFKLHASALQYNV